MPESRRTPASFPLAGLLQLADLAQNQVALQRAQAPQEEDAVEVVDLVLESARQKLRSFRLEPFTLKVLRPDLHLRRARYFLANIRQAQAALFRNLPAFLLDDLRVHEDDLVIRVLFVAEIDHGDALRHADLWRCQTDPLRLVHGLEHILGQGAQFLIELRDLLRRPLEDGVRIFDDVPNHCHKTAYSRGAGGALVTPDLFCVAVVVALEFPE